MDNKLHIRQLHAFSQLDAVESWVNTTLNDRFNVTNPLKVQIDGNKSIELFVNEAIQISPTDNALGLELPLDIKAQLDFPIATIEAHASVIAHLRIEIRLSEAMVLQTRTNVSGLVWVSGPDFTPRIVDMLMPEVKIKSRIEDMLPDLGMKIDEALSERLSFSELVNKINWDRRIVLNSGNPDHIYLNVRPEQVIIYKPELNTDESMQIGVDGELFFHFDGTPTETMSDYLPQVKYLEKSETENQSSVDTELQIDQLGLILFSYVKANPIIEKTLKCTVERILTKPAGEAGLAVALKVSGIIRGALSIACEPVINVAKGELDLKNLRFNFSGSDWSSSIKGQAGLWLMKNFIKRSLPFDLKNFLLNKLNELKAERDTVHLTDGLKLKLKIDEFKIEAYKIGNGTIQMSFSLGNEAGIIVF